MEKANILQGGRCISENSTQYISAEHTPQFKLQQLECE